MDAAGLLETSVRVCQPTLRRHHASPLPSQAQQQCHCTNAGVQPGLNYGEDSRTGRDLRLSQRRY